MGERRPWYKKERKAFRHAHYKAFRRAVAAAVRTGREIPRYRRTGGWLSS